MARSLEFHERVRALRELRGMGVNDLNARANLANGAVSRIEFGDRPNVTAETVAAIAEALDTTMDWLWRGAGPSPLQSVGRVPLPRRRRARVKPPLPHARVSA